MKFGSMAVVKAEGCILAHSIGGLKKGRRLSCGDVDDLRAQGISDVIAARLDKSDVAEDEAAAAIAKAICGVGVAEQAPFTGRANLHARVAGLVRVDEALLAKVNRVHEAITIATLRDHERVAPRQMLATVKIIPYAAPRAALAKVLRFLKGKRLVKVAAFKRQRVGLIITSTPGGKETLIKKSEQAIAARLESLGSSLSAVAVTPHKTQDVAAALREMKSKGLSPILIFGAAAIVDRADVVPAAVRLAKGRVTHLGMPVDPGNLLMLGALGTTPVVGVPTCARSPKVNGFDFVLNRLCAGLKVTHEDVAAMGAGGLLGEIASRPQPREGAATSPMKPKVTAIVLAAGTSSRMGANKLLSDLHGQNLLAQTLARIAAAQVDEMIVVTGHMADEVAAVARNAGARVVHNPHFALGLATSLRAGLAAATDADAALICLGDMPLVLAADIDRQIAAFSPADGRSIIVPVRGRKRGNPVLWGADHFPALMALEGDTGARALIDQHRDDVTEIEVQHEGIFLDADTPEALAVIRAAKA